MGASSCSPFFGVFIDLLAGSTGLHMGEKTLLFMILADLLNGEGGIASNTVYVTC